MGWPCSVVYASTTGLALPPPLRFVGTLVRGNSSRNYEPVEELRDASRAGVLLYGHAGVSDFY